LGSRGPGWGEAGGGMECGRMRHGYRLAKQGMPAAVPAAAGTAPLRSRAVHEKAAATTRKDATPCGSLWELDEGRTCVMGPGPGGRDRAVSGGVALAVSAAVTCRCFARWFTGEGARSRDGSPIGDGLCAGGPSGRGGRASRSFCLPKALVHALLLWQRPRTASHYPEDT
jgi:hypothetical protein